MSRKKIVILFTIFVLAIVGVRFYMSNLSQNDQSNELPDELYTKFECGRNTLDHRSTDIYCNNYELYKKDKAAGIIQ